MFERVQMLDAGDLVAGCAVVFCELRFDDDLPVVFARNHEIGRLVEAGTRSARFVLR